MKPEDYYTTEQGRISFDREKSSQFAKLIANDFNPLHDADARRFCVPGDLLLVAALDLLGLRQCMKVEFLKLVDDTTSLQLLQHEGYSAFTGDDGKEYLRITSSGERVGDPESAAQVTHECVKFSGQTFPYLLVDLMKAEQSMINPSRPLVMYKSIAIDLQQPDFSGAILQSTESTLQVDGNRGEAILRFELLDEERNPVGSGDKRMLLSGLREYDQQMVDDLVDRYREIKDAFQARP